MGSSALVANAALSLLNLTCHLLDRQLAAQAKAFDAEVGFTERLCRGAQRPPEKPMKLVLTVLLLLALGAANAAPAPTPDGLLHHQLSVRLNPADRSLAVTDRLTLPAGAAPGFALHAGLFPTTDTQGAVLTRVDGPAAAGFAAAPNSAVPLEWYRVELPAGADQLTLYYGGELHHPLSQDETYARGFRETPGTISAEGVFLSQSTAWVPWLGAERLTFDLAVELPPGWEAVSQGAREEHAVGPSATQVRWRDSTPQEEVYLIAAPFFEYNGAAGGTELQVFLRAEDQALAGKYLEVGGQYLRMYSELLGAYPYPKFALVENFWETGYGMPSFSLLGPRVIRFPFILHSSYPHEILHNWWGNGVYVAWEQGNWCEGLTAYLADHLIQEGRGQGTEYRQTTLQKYADYVSADAGRDFPLAEFRSRHSSASEAVGYGKSLFFYHMLRRELGDATFIAGLRRFYREQRFRTATFDDLRTALEAEAGRDLGAAFFQWVRRPGAPRLTAGPARVNGGAGGWRLELPLRQVQEGELFALSVPVAVTTADGAVAVHQVSLDGTETVAALDLADRPVRVDVDPEFDLFRLLDPRELPPALSGAFGAKRVTVVLPAAAPVALLQGYRELAEGWARSQPGAWTVVEDAALERLPADAGVWVLGWENRWRPAALDTLAPYDAAVTEAGVRVERGELPRAGHSFALVGRHPAEPSLTVTWLATDTPAALPGLGRKLPHYHKYSYLAFEGAEPENVAKGRWPAVDSPLRVTLEPGGERGNLPERRPLTELPPAYSSVRLGADIAYLTAPEREGRGFGSAGLEAARDHIAEAFAAAGLAPGGDDGTYLQCWTAVGGDPPTETRLCNVLGVLPGTNPQWAEQSVVLGAHYDHLGLGWPDARAEHRGQVHPGADDNASGVAVLLELARVLAPRWQPERSVVFAAFAGEEAGRLGSQHYVATARRYPARAALGMVNLDTVGRLGEGKLLALGTGTAREWVHIFRGAGFVTGVPIETVADDVGGSDQVSFVAVGVPAVQLFTGPHGDYHRPGDTAEKVDLPGLVRVAEVTREVVEYLAGRPEPMAGTLEGAAPAPNPSGPRTVSLGIIPDFAYPGPGLKLSGVTPGSPAAAAGLREGDLLLRVGGEGLETLSDLSRLLKEARPGDRLELTVDRNGEPVTREAVLGER